VTCARKLTMTGYPPPLLSFDDMLALIEDRSAALRAAAPAAGLTARVPACPNWSVADLVSHLGEVHLLWAAVATAGPSASPPERSAVGDTTPHGDVLDWLADATGKLVQALGAAGPDRGCWTWWESSGAPMTSGAVARHQVHEAAIHALDAQQAAGISEALPAHVAADGVAEFLTVELPTNGAWPHDPARIVLDTGEHGAWLLNLGRDGVRVSLLSGDEISPAGSTVTASPSDLVLALYRRQGHAGMRVAGDAKTFERLLEWPNLD
jgi:uncharacterized protein (TIGR03083 family)